MPPIVEVKITTYSNNKVFGIALKWVYYRVQGSDGWFYDTGYLFMCFAKRRAKKLLKQRARQIEKEVYRSSYLLPQVKPTLADKLIREHKSLTNEEIRDMAHGYDNTQMGAAIAPAERN